MKLSERIDVQCPACERTFLDVAVHVHRKGSCPDCAQTFQISINYSVAGAGSFDRAIRVRQTVSSAMAAGTVGSHPQALITDPKGAEAVLRALEGRIQPVRSNATYRLSILLAALVMLLLPVIYIGLIVIVSWGVYHHAVNHLGMLMSARGHLIRFALLAYVLPIIVGPVLVLFMIKPLFARPQRCRQKRSLNRESEPLLFAFVDRVCSAVGAPPPKRIDVDCRVNASASLRHGVWSIFWRGDLVLTIGLPIVAGLNTRQFAGILAHEFGHFSQGTGMRLSYLVRCLSHWFHRVVYERDRWDAWLDARMENAHSTLVVVASGLAQLFVWLTRRALWLLMMIGHRAACVLLRQMEFDADRHQVRLVGSDILKGTLQLLTEKEVAMRCAQADLQLFYRDGKLVDDLPNLMMVRLETMPDDVRWQIRQSMNDYEVHWWDTHPPTGERIANAAREDREGLFHVELPATVLFSDFAVLCRAATLDFYRGAFGQRFDPRVIRPLRDLLVGTE